MKLFRGGETASDAETSDAGGPSDDSAHAQVPLHDRLHEDRPGPDVTHTRDETGRLSRSAELPGGRTAALLFGQDGSVFASATGHDGSPLTLFVTRDGLRAELAPCTIAELDAYHLDNAGQPSGFVDLNTTLPGELSAKRHHKNTNNGERVSTKSRFGNELGKVDFRYSTKRGAVLRVRRASGEIFTYRVSPDGQAEVVLRHNRKEDRLPGRLGPPPPKRRLLG